jgi:enoyl-CoA hydratase/carnithine racemase
MNDTNNGRFILKSQENRIGTLQFNNEAKLNALNHEMMREFIDGILELEQEDVQVIVLRARPGARI